MDFALTKLLDKEREILDKQVVLRPYREGGAVRSGVCEGEGGLRGVFHTQVEYQNGREAQHLFYAFSLFRFDFLSRTICVPT